MRRLEERLTVHMPGFFCSGKGGGGEGVRLRTPVQTPAAERREEVRTWEEIMRTERDPVSYWLERSRGGARCQRDVSDDLSPRLQSDVQG